jgi:hypothetical protein
MPIRKPELPPELAVWAKTPGGEYFCASLRQRIANGGGVDRPLSLTLTDGQRSDLIRLFGIDAVGPRTVHLGRAQKALLSSRFALTLRGLLIAEGGPLITTRGRARHNRIMKSAAIARERLDLLLDIAGVPDLADEHQLLTAFAPTDRWLTPPGSRTGAAAWSVHRSSLRAAAEWYRGRDRGWRFGERELAALALGGSKCWTDPVRIAFCRLIGLPFAEAVHTTDTEVLVVGPLRWIREHLVADAGLAAPFIGLPGKATGREGLLDVPAIGILLVENKETFETVGRTRIPETWLCVWHKGFGSDALVELLRALPPITVAAWGDLDPPGIEIIENLAARSGRAIHPVGMEVADYAHGTYLEEPSSARAQWRVKAEELAATVQPKFVPLARAIAANDGWRCEQECLHERIIPDLPEQLARLAKQPTGSTSDLMIHDRWSR